MKFIEKLGEPKSLANKLTLSRLFAVPLIFVLYLIDFSFLKILASFLFLLAALTDFLDGYIARKYNTVSTLGQLLDPVADKILIMASLILLIANGDIPKYLTFIPTLIIAREIFISGVRLIALEKKIQIHVRSSGKWKTAFQATSIFLLMFSGATPTNANYFKEAGWFFLLISAVFSIYSALQYWNHFWNESKKEFLN